MTREELKELQERILRYRAQHERIVLPDGKKAKRLKDCNDLRKCFFCGGKAESSVMECGRWVPICHDHLMISFGVTWLPCGIRRPDVERPVVMMHLETEGSVICSVRNSPANFESSPAWENGIRAMEDASAAVEDV